jgi:hypothetical protein
VVGRQNIKYFMTMEISTSQLYLIAFFGLGGVLWEYIFLLEALQEEVV